MSYGYLDPFVGAQLKQKREQQQLSLEDIAIALRLSKKDISDIEENNFTKLPHTYLKGYVRAYAKLLAVSDEDIDVYLMNANKASSLKGWHVFSTHKQLSMSNRLVQWVTFGIIATLILLVALWWKADNALANLTFGDLPEASVTIAQNDVKANK